MFWKTNTAQISQIEKIDKALKERPIALIVDNECYLITSYEAGSGKYRMYGELLDRARLVIKNNKYVDISMDAVENVLKMSKQLSSFQLLFETIKAYEKNCERAEELVKQILSQHKEIPYSDSIKPSQGDFYISFGYIYYTVNNYKNGYHDVVKICRSDYYKIEPGLSSSKIESDELLQELLELYKIRVEARGIIDNCFSIIADVVKTYR